MYLPQTRVLPDLGCLPPRNLLAYKVFPFFPEYETYLAVPLPRKPPSLPSYSFLLMFWYLFEHKALHFLVQEALDLAWEIGAFGYFL